MNKLPAIRKVRNLKKITSLEDLYHKYIRSINGVLAESITPQESNILFIIYQNGGVLTTEIRKTICSKLSISDKNLNNVISRFRKKFYLKDDKLAEYLILPKLDGHDKLFVESIFLYELE